MKKYISIFLALLQFNLISLFGISCKQESTIPKTPDNSLITDFRAKAHRK